MVDSAAQAALEEVVVADRCVVVEEVVAESADLSPTKRTCSTVFLDHLFWQPLIHRAPTLLLVLFDLLPKKLSFNPVTRKHNRYIKTDYVLYRLYSTYKENMSLCLPLLYKGFTSPVLKQIVFCTYLDHLLSLSHNTTRFKFKNRFCSFVDI
jgi:hypothetical protein